jgi:osmotically inducible protein OsmC
VEVTWAARTEQPDGKTSPEELLAAAHAACYAMAFSNTLVKRGNRPERLQVEAVCTFDKTDTGYKVGSVTLTVKGEVPGMDQTAFEEAAREGEQGCPVSNALRGNVEIRVEAQLETAGVPS